MSTKITLTIPLPFYPPDPQGQFCNATCTPTASHDVTRTPWGSFSYRPGYDRDVSMIDTAAGLIADKHSIGTRPRSDMTGYAYTNRSYGVGSSVGLLSNSNKEIDLGYIQATIFRYQEIWYYADVTCGRNSSASKNPTITPATQSTLNYSIEKGLKSIIDDFLLAFASAQLVLNGDTSTNNTDGLLEVSAVQYGNQGYNYSLFAFNIILIIIFIEEVIRTHLWSGLPARDNDNLNAVILASSLGRIELGNKVDAVYK